MFKPSTLLLAAALAAASGAPLRAAPAAPVDLDQQVRCSIIFGLIAGMQDHHSAGWDRFAAMDQPGLQFMNNTVDRLRTERGIAKSKVRDFLMKQLDVIIPQLAAEKDTDAAFDAEMAVCLPLLDQVVPDWRQLPAK